MNKGEIISLDEPKKIRESIHKDICEIVTPEARKAYKLIQQNIKNEVQLFGDRINAVVDNYVTESVNIENMLKEHDIPIESKRRIPPSLENVFIHLVKETS
jgi:ABC-type multidrug transport system ATPase subunit